MKCEACKYEYEEVENEEDYTIEVIRGDAPFFETSHNLTINEKQGEWDCDRLEIKPICVCPKCGALLVNLD